MNMREKQLSHEYFFEGRIMKARLDQVELPNGRTAPREVCEHVGGVGVLPIDRDGNIILVRQFRYPYDAEILEIPAGKLDHGEGESIADCGARELREETGCTAGRIIPLGCVYPSPGFLTEVVRLPIAEVEQLIVRDEIRDAKTVTAMYRAKLKNLF